MGQVCNKWQSMEVFLLSIEGMVEEVKDTKYVLGDQASNHGEWERWEHFSVLYEKFFTVSHQYIIRSSGGSFHRSLLI